MGKLILTSGGYIDGQRGPDCDAVIEKIARNKKVLIIDNATLTGSNTKGLPILKANFEKIAKSVEFLSLNAENLSKIHEFDVIYITGGDTTPLIQLNANSNTKQEFLKFLYDNKSIIGESAGSMIFGKNLKYAYDIKKGTKPKYDIELPDYSGFGLVDISFFPHWNKVAEDMQQKVLNYEAEHNTKLTRVKDGDLLLYEIKKVEKFEL